MDGLKPETTYYYTVDSMEANGNDDGVKSSLRYFHTCCIWSARTLDARSL